jgi:hypothetical protein
LLPIPSIVVFFLILENYFTARSKIMKSRVQDLAEQINMSVDEFVGEMRKLGCSEPTALKIWRGEYEDYEDFDDNNVQLSNLRKAAYVLKVGTGILVPK